MPGVRVGRGGGREEGAAARLPHCEGEGLVDRGRDAALPRYPLLLLHTSSRRVTSFMSIFYPGSTAESVEGMLLRRGLPVRQKEKADSGTCTLPRLSPQKKQVGQTTVAEQADGRCEGAKASRNGHAALCLCLRPGSRDARGTRRGRGEGEARSTQSSGGGGGLPSEAFPRISRAGSIGLISQVCNQAVRTLRVPVRSAGTASSFRGTAASTGAS